MRLAGRGIDGNQLTAVDLDRDVLPDRAILDACQHNRRLRAYRRPMKSAAIILVVVACVAVATLSMIVIVSFIALD